MRLDSITDHLERVMAYLVGNDLNGLKLEVLNAIIAHKKAIIPSAGINLSILKLCSRVINK